MRKRARQLIPGTWSAENLSNSEGKLTDIVEQSFETDRHSPIEGLSDRADDEAVNMFSQNLVRQGDGCCGQPRRIIG